jgi:hypothetical protein
MELFHLCQCCRVPTRAANNKPSVGVLHQASCYEIIGTIVNPGKEVVNNADVYGASPALEPPRTRPVWCHNRFDVNPCPTPHRRSSGRRQRPCAAQRARGGDRQRASRRVAISP